MVWRGNARYPHSGSEDGMPHYSRLMQQSRKALFSFTTEFPAEDYKARDYEKGSTRLILRFLPLWVDPDCSTTSSRT